MSVNHLPEPSSLRGIVHWVPEQLNIKAVTGACKLIDGCILGCVRPLFQWYQLAYATEIKSVQLHDSIVSLSQKRVSFTSHYITNVDLDFGLTHNKTILLVKLVCTSGLSGLDQNVNIIKLPQ